MPQPVAISRRLDAERIAIRLTSQQKRLLEQITRARTNPYRLVQRAQLILWAAEGMTNTEIASTDTINTRTGAIMANKMAKCRARMGASEIRRYRG
ncbi:hypothetical protein [Brasilonema sp. UFV-L1]|uniref:hypothetical protein n=1 Tax=Brasilonema sp. UFV-L1 TaxID=2234130 RepID=UPI001B7D0470|nr:hypothetical protein [Brasilonema sp. UFV-L1]